MRPGVFLRALLKGGLIAGVVGLYLLLAGLLSLLPVGEARRRRWAVALVAWAARGSLASAGIRVRRSGPIPEAGSLIVANHVSYLDIPVLASLFEPVFVPSTEVGEARVEGLMARLGGSHFVDRRNKFNLPGEIGGVARLLAEGRRVAVFPEATTTDGRGLRPFRAALFESARAAKRPVVPVCIQYERLDGRPVDTANRDKLFYYGDMAFLPQVGRLLTIRSAEVSVTVTPPLDGALPDRKAMARAAEARVRALYRPIP